MVTYGIPVVAIIWGMLYGEDVGIAQWSCMFIILLGVFLATRK
jgi:drug/metabolite transporter (DMT)-like permease